ncbi:DUF933 domain-containing protein [Shigella flexneri]
MHGPFRLGQRCCRAAGKIHTDFEKGFIRAQTISFEISSLTKVNKARKKQAKCVQKVTITS